MSRYLGPRRGVARVARAARIFVTGGSGAGKTTLGERLRDRLGLPLFHTDHIARVARETRANFAKLLAERAAEERWIIEGAAVRALDVVLERADVAIFIDVPVLRAAAAAFVRNAKRTDAGTIGERLRPSQWTGSRVRRALGAWRHLLLWRASVRPVFVRRLAEVRAPVVRLRSRADVAVLVEGLG